MDYISLSNRKAELELKLEDLDAEQFGAISNEEMDDIKRRRRDIEAEIRLIDSVLYSE